MKLGLALLVAVLLAPFAPAIAQDSSGTLAPADEYFGRFNLSVLGIANSIRDAGARLDAGNDARTLVTGPLAFATDALRAWEQKYPSDPWIAKDLLALETVYLKIPTDDGSRLASQTAAWLTTDYPKSAAAVRGRTELAGITEQSVRPQTAPPQQPSYASAWDRFAALRAPLGPPH